MAYKDMTKDQGLSGVISLFSEDTLTGAANGPWIIFPPGVKLSVILSSTGTGKVQVTNAKLAHITADTVPAGSIIDWDNGAVASGQATIEVCSALRLVSVSGTTSLYTYSTKLG